jgi:hypothetical protein
MDFDAKLTDFQGVDRDSTVCFFGVWGTQFYRFVDLNFLSRGFGYEDS